MAELTVAQIVDKQVRNVTAALEDVRQGVEAVTVSPTQLAAQNIDKMRDGLLRTIESGKTAKRLRAVTLEDWKAATLAKIDRIPAGIEQARGKLTVFHEQRQRIQGTINTKLRDIPTRTLSDNIRRMTTQVQEMAKFSFDSGTT